MAYPHPSDEIERLELLAALDLVEGPVPATWDRIARLAQSRFAVPYAAVTLITRDEQHLRSACGFAVGRMPRTHAFCNWTILHDEVFVVPDAHRHTDLSQNALVVGEPGIRFYAGAPLIIAGGVRIGAVCVIDTQPRDFTPAEAVVLRQLARIAADEIWLTALESGFTVEPVPDRRVPISRPRLTVEQIRGGRGMLGWSVEALASAAGVSSATVKRAEATDRHHGVGDDYIDLIRNALEAAGLDFLFTPGAAPGVRPRILAASAA